MELFTLFYTNWMAEQGVDREAVTLVFGEEALLEVQLDGYVLAGYASTTRSGPRIKVFVPAESLLTSDEYAKKYDEIPYCKEVSE